MANTGKKQENFELSSIFEEVIEEVNQQTPPATADEDEEFNRLLNEFIASELQDVEVDAEDKKEAERRVKREKPQQPQKITESKEQEQPSPAPLPTVEEEKSSVILCNEEQALYDAFENFKSAIQSMCSDNNEKSPEFKITKDLLFPRFKPAKAKEFIDAAMLGWDKMLKFHGQHLEDLNPEASDDEILNFAEKETDENLQMALIAYVEILIEIESCDIAYEERRIKAKKRYIERKIIEEHEARQAKIKMYIERINAQKFPIDAEKLVLNYFKTARKDPDGARDVLFNNPATYSPILVEKIPNKLFGLIKSKPEDGIKFNRIIGNFLKKLKA